MYTSESCPEAIFKGMALFSDPIIGRFIVCDDPMFHVRKIRIFFYDTNFSWVLIIHYQGTSYLCLFIISGSNLSCDFSIFIFLKVVYVCSGLELTISSVRDIVCPSSILSVPNWKEGRLCSVKCFSKIIHVGGGIFTSVPSGLLSLVS